MPRSGSSSCPLWRVPPASAGWLAARCSILPPKAGSIRRARRGRTFHRGAARMTWLTFAAPQRLARWAAAWQWPRSARAEPSLAEGRVEVAVRGELARLREWRDAFADLRKDHRYYEL